MTLLDRYIAGELAKALFVVMLALVPLFGFLDLIQQLDDVGSGTYGLMDALMFEVRMTAPRFIELLPFGALMSSTIALALLAQHGEVIAAQVCGIAVSRISWAVLKSALLLMFAAALLDEFLISALHQQAVLQRSLQLSASQIQQSDSGFWMRHGNRFIYINRILYGRVPADIDILELDDEKQVKLFIHAKQADIDNPGNWLLMDLVLKRLDKDGIVTEHHASMNWESFMTPEQIGLLGFSPPTMSASQLYRYIQYLTISGQQTDRYELAFWKKLTLPLATGVMVLLAIPSAFGTPRSTSVGKRAILALGGGLLYQIVTQVVVNVGLIWEFNPAFTTLITPAVTALIALIVLSRVAA